MQRPAKKRCMGATAGDNFVRELAVLIESRGGKPEQLAKKLGFNYAYGAPINRIITVNSCVCLRTRRLRMHNCLVSCELCQRNEHAQLLLKL